MCLLAMPRSNKVADIPHASLDVCKVLGLTLGPDRFSVELLPFIKSWKFLIWPNRASGSGP